MILIGIVLFIQTVLSANNTITLLSKQSHQLQVSASSELSLDILQSQFQYILVQLDSCKLNKVKVQTSQLLPPTALFQFSNTYFINKQPVKININYSDINTKSLLTVFGFNHYSQLPSNKRLITTFWSDQQLHVTFDPINIYGTVVQCNYTIQFRSSPSQFNCKLNDTQHVFGQIQIPLNISNNLTNIALKIPLHNQNNKNYALYSFNRLEKIQQLISSGSKFEIQIYAKITKPFAIDVSYSKLIVEPEQSIEALRNGFIIIVMGVAVYIIVTCIYLYCKRKFKNPDYFHEQPQTHPHDDGTNRGVPPKTNSQQQFKHKHDND